MLNPVVSRSLGQPSDASKSVERAVNRASLIAGWMDRGELIWLAEQALLCREIAEVGSWCGRSAKALSVTPGRVICVDNWSGVVGWPTEDFPASFARNLEAEIACCVVVPIRADSVDAAARFADGTFDMVFIDGAHNLESVTADLRAWTPKVAPGGLLCGHDYHEPGVRQAVEAMFGEADNVVQNPAGTIWVVQR